MNSYPLGKYCQNQPTHRDHCNRNAVHEAHALAEDEDCDEDGKDDAQLVDRSHLRHRAVLECQKVNEPRKRTRNAAECNEEQRSAM